MVTHLLEKISDRSANICIIGLGYVGLPLAIEFAKKFSNVFGFDICQNKVAKLNQYIDDTGELNNTDLKSTSAIFSSDPQILSKADFIIVTVPTPIDNRNKPNLDPVKSASKLIGENMSPDTVVIYESTVYPGVTEDVCKPILESTSQMTYQTDFFLGYSPERINPGDKQNTLTSIVKIVSGDTSASCKVVAELYDSILENPTYQAASIKVAEAAKVLENTQRDLNIALMNELSLIFNKMNISTNEVVNAAATKWNFMNVKPGLVGGHCIGVDPYYLSYKAEELGYHPEVILAGRRVNDNMGKHIANEMIKLMVRADIPIRNSKIGILGLTFKPNVPDIRNTKVVDIINELTEYGVHILVHDPYADPQEVSNEYGITLTEIDQLTHLDGILIAVPHKAYNSISTDMLCAKIKNSRKVIYDLTSFLTKSTITSKNIIYKTL